MTPTGQYDPIRTIRVPDSVWHTARDLARDRGTSVSAEIQRFLRWYIRTPGVARPTRPAERAG